MNELENIYHTYFKDVFLYLKSLSQNDDIAEEITVLIALKIKVSAPVLPDLPPALQNFPFKLLIHLASDE